MWEMWSRQEPWQDIKMPYAVRVENCLHRNQRPPMPPDTPAPLRDLIELCWATNFKLRPTAQEILSVHLPLLDAWCAAEKTMLQLPRALHQRKMGGSLIVAPVTPRSIDVPQKVPSGELVSWQNFLFSSAPEVMLKKPPIEVTHSAPILPKTLKKLEATPSSPSPLSLGSQECDQI